MWLEKSQNEQDSKNTSQLGGGRKETRGGAGQDKSSAIVRYIKKQSYAMCHV